MLQEDREMTGVYGYNSLIAYTINTSDIENISVLKHLTIQTSERYPKRKQEEIVYCFIKVIRNNI